MNHEWRLSRSYGLNINTVFVITFRKRFLTCYRHTFILLNLFFLLHASSFAAYSKPYVYIFPEPDTKMVSPGTSLIVRFQDFIQNQLPDINSVFTVKGMKSGPHSGQTIWSDDEKTLLFEPDIPFVPGESVSAHIKFGSAPSESFSFQFEISSFPCSENLLKNPTPDEEEDYTPAVKTVGRITTINGVTVPEDFPDINILTLKNTAPGKIFFGSTFTDIGNYLVIMENDGTPYFYRRYPREYQGSGEFKLQPSGLLTAYLFQFQFFIALNHHYAEVDTYRVGHGYTTDPHELVVLPNGHALMIALDYQKMDMSSMITGGKKNATVIGNHVQEIDNNDHVIFEWRSWDHYNVIDATYENLTANSIDYAHMNSIAVDDDGHLIVSVRNLSEVTKFNSETGDVIWRLGGVHNQFRWINDDFGFSYQHYVRPVPGKPGHYTIFDNGNFREPLFSRAMEFRLDTDRMTAEKVWEFRYNPDRYSNMMGSVQRLENGNTFINWSTWPPLFACEVTPDNEVVFEMEAIGTSSNRVRRFEWEGSLIAPYLIIESHGSGIALIFNKFGDHVDHYNIYGDTHPDPNNLLLTSKNTFAVLTDLQNNAQWYFRVTAVDLSGNESGFSNTEIINTHLIDPGNNSVRNGDFSQGQSNWTLRISGNAQAAGRITDGAYHVQISRGGSSFEEIQVFQENIELITGKKYMFEFDAFAENNRFMDAGIIQNASPYNNYGKIGPSYIKKQNQHYTYEFIMEESSDFNAILIFSCGESDGDIFIDNVSLKEVVSSDTHRIEPVPQTFHLYQNYPNPFNAMTHISFDLPQDSRVTVKVFDLHGRELKTVFNAYKPAGFHTVILDVRDLPSSLYFYSAETANVSEFGKMLLIK